ncbi:MAG: hypothetical protein E7H33_09630 [Clostridium perfringens]|nr:hypothetical protein [Clostridium perfringens]
MSKKIKLLETIIKEFRYESEEDRDLHVEQMKKMGGYVMGKLENLMIPYRDIKTENIIGLLDFKNS